MKLQYLQLGYDFDEVCQQGREILVELDQVEAQLAILLPSDQPVSQELVAHVDDDTALKMRALTKRFEDLYTKFNALFTIRGYDQPMQTAVREGLAARGSCIAVAIRRHAEQAHSQA